MVVLDKLAWSFNGQEVVFSAFPPPPSERFSYGLFFMDSSGNIQRTIWENPNIPFGRLIWLPDGYRILFTSNGNLYTLDLGTEAVELFMESAESADWEDPARFQLAVSPHGKMNTPWRTIKEP